MTAHSLDVPVLKWEQGLSKKDNDYANRLVTPAGGPAKWLPSCLPVTWWLVLMNGRQRRPNELKAWQ